MSVCGTASGTLSWIEGGVRVSKFREWEPLKNEIVFRFEDRLIIERLLESKKLTDKQREAIHRLLANFDYVRD